MAKGQSLVLFTHMNSINITSSLHKTCFLPALRYYSKLNFITIDINVLFVHIVNSFELDIILIDVVKMLWTIRIYINEKEEEFTLAKSW